MRKGGREGGREGYTLYLIADAICVSCALDCINYRRKRWERKRGREGKERGSGSDGNRTRGKGSEWRKVKRRKEER